MAVQVQLLQAGVLTVNEVRAMRGWGRWAGWNHATDGRGGSGMGKLMDSESGSPGPDRVWPGKRKQMGESACDWKRWR